MAQIGYGYGSEFQLLRFLGHHRHELENRISDTIKEYGNFNWLDFGYADQRVTISGDKEIKALNFLESLIPQKAFQEIINEYHSYAINKIDEWQNWDAIFVLNECVYLVEAKAHVSEISDDKIHGGKSGSSILRYFRDQLPTLNVNEDWLKEYYQLANRLATTALLNKHGVKAKTLYIYFENGFNKRRKSSENATKADYEQALRIEMNTLGITESDVDNLLAPPIFINANPMQ